jgi:hypothetical protein
MLQSIQFNPFVMTPQAPVKAAGGPTGYNVHEVRYGIHQAVATAELKPQAQTATVGSRLYAMA